MSGWEGSRGRGWCFTHFYSNEQEISWFKNLFLTFEKPQIKYLCFGYEICPKTNRKHLQGYIYFQNQVMFNTLKKKILLEGTHIEFAYGNPIQNKIYCSKPESKDPGVNPNFEEFGKIPEGCGARTDISEAIKMRQEGATLSEIAQCGAGYQATAICKFITPNMPNKFYSEKKVYWFWGPSGTGKTKKALELIGEDPYWKSGESGKWWNGFDSTCKWVLLDDIRGDFCTFHRFLNILDKYPCWVEVKGGVEMLTNQNIIITCPYSPESLYKGVSEESINQLTRRVDRVEFFSSQKSQISGVECNTINSTQGPSGPAALPRLQIVLSPKKNSQIELENFIIGRG